MNTNAGSSARHPITPGVACIPGWLGARIAYMKSAVAPTSRFTKALLEAPLDELQAEMREVRQAMYQLEAHANLLNMAIEWKIAHKAETDGKTAAAADDDIDWDAPIKPRSLREAILLVLADATQPLRTAEVYRELEQRGWLPGGANPKSQLAARLSKMYEKGVVTRSGTPARYRLPTQGTEEAG